MNNKFAIVLRESSAIGERAELVARSWGDLPVSHIQDCESLSVSDFLDIKVNKWEVNTRWRRFGIEPWIRIGILRAGAVSAFLKKNEFCPPVSSEAAVLLVLELDEDGGDIDRLLLLRLVCVLSAGRSFYCFIEDSQMFKEELVDFPSLEYVRDKIIDFR